uniref:Putative methyltransferase-like protein 17 n=1 Tax=Lutzomyia longipalpis TaxID=7200 RepID=A0A1B0CI71_LUTLO
FATKVSVELEQNVAKALEKVEYKPRKHPGVVKVKTIPMPEFLEETIPKVIGDYPLGAICRDAEALDRYLWSRHPPPTERHDANNKLYNKVQARLKKEVYAWKNMQYDTYTSLQYLLGRSPGEYAAMYRILTEIRDRDPSFTPRSYFDFGSGVGSALWATIGIWPKGGIFEYFMVDASAEMNDLAEQILRRGNHDKEPMIRNFFFRQFLPASTTNTYDLVVCAYTLFELPSKDARLKTIKTLWAKCENYLILVERGTRVGFHLITEARNFLLKIDPENCHVHSPCPHDATCPRLADPDKTPCNFEAKYENLQAFHKDRYKTETFSYVVLQKKPRDPCRTENSWPRIVRPVLVRSKHSICRMCTKEGRLQEIIFTAAKHGKQVYQCARKSNLGDRLPISIINPESEEVENDLSPHFEE